MADAEARAKAEKLAAAKKRVEALKKQKARKVGDKKEEASDAAPKGSIVEEKPTNEDEREVDNNGDAATTTEAAKHTEDPPIQEATLSHGRKPSISVQSKMRSSSFRQSIASPSATPANLKSPTFNPEEDNAHEIFRKQAGRIEELEKENKRLAKEAIDGEKRWKKAEEELEDLREAEGEASIPKASLKDAGSAANEVEKLKTELAALQRQNTQLQAQVTRTGRHGSSPSVSLGTAPGDDVSALLASKSSTIESMEIEISNLSAQLARNASGSTAEREQIAALTEKLARTQTSLDTSQRELFDLKKNLEHTTAKAVKEGSERTSAETKLRTLSREAEEAKSQSAELQRKVEALEKKVLTLTTLHKEHDARSQALKKEREKADKNAAELRQRLAGIENENLRLREERERYKKREAQGIDDDGVDELENEERQRLEAKVRDLEAEVFELRRGVWKERRHELDGDHSGVTSPGAKFTDIDLTGSPGRRRSLAPGGSTKGLGDFFSAFTGAMTGGTDDQLLDDDNEVDFDEEAFRLAQEEEARKRLERVKDIKRKLGDWKGWRLDLVETRRGGGEGAGEIFEV